MTSLFGWQHPLDVTVQKGLPVGVVNGSSISTRSNQGNVDKGNTKPSHHETSDSHGCKVKHKLGVYQKERNKNPTFDDDDDDDDNNNKDGKVNGRNVLRGYGSKATNTGGRCGSGDWSRGRFSGRFDGCRLHDAEKG